MMTIYVGSFNHLHKRHEFVARGLPSTLLSIPHNSVDKIRLIVRKWYHHQNTNQERPLHLGISQSVIRIRHRGILQDKN